jgi:1,4-dihydroxy-2-naphthoate polyprenyltransferase
MGAIGMTAPAATASHLDFRVGLLRLADPKITLASAAGLFLAACSAAAAGVVAWEWLLVVVGGIFALEAAKNASGEIFDWDSGTDLRVTPADRTPFSGGKRVLVDGLLTRRQTAVIAAAGYALAIAAGILVAWLREPRVLLLGLLGLAGAWFYHAPPFRLSYRGFGELAVALCYGPLLVAGTYLTLRQELSLVAVAASIPLAILVAAFLWINEVPDAPADAASGKRTLVVRLGRQRAVRLLGALFALAFLVLLTIPLFGSPWTVLLGLIAVPKAWQAARLARAARDSRELVPAQTATLVAFLLYALGAGVGLLLNPGVFQ